MGKTYGTDLDGRITFLNDQGLLRDAPKIQALRKKRNELAHKASHSCSWSELEEP
jgi:hypothetical protein